MWLARNSSTWWQNHHTVVLSIIQSIKCQKGQKRELQKLEINVDPLCKLWWGDTFLRVGELKIGIRYKGDGLNVKFQKPIHKYKEIKNWITTKKSTKRNLSEKKLLTSSNKQKLTQNGSQI